MQYNGRAKVMSNSLSEVRSFAPIEKVADGAQVGEPVKEPGEPFGSPRTAAIKRYSRRTKRRA